MRGNLRFTGGNAGSLVQAMEIIGGSGSDAGNVGVGDFREFTPASQLHIHRHPSSTNADFQITSNAAGELTTDGLKLEVAHTTPIAYIKQQEDAPII